MLLFWCAIPLPKQQRFKSKKTTTIFFSVFYKRMQYRANVSVVGQVTNSRPSVRNSCKIVSIFQTKNQ
jgi:hypothetical protein